jgi:hypothetical protein
MGLQSRLAPPFAGRLASVSDRFGVRWCPLFGIGWTAHGTGNMMYARRFVTGAGKLSVRCRARSKRKCGTGWAKTRNFGNHSLYLTFSGGSLSAKERLRCYPWLNSWVELVPSADLAPAFPTGGPLPSESVRYYAAILCLLDSRAKSIFVQWIGQWSLSSRCGISQNQ